MTRQFSLLRAGAIAGVLGLGLVGCAGGGGVATGSGYGNDLMFDTLTGGGIIPKRKAAIDYSPRTGLVVPADAEALPAPQPQRVVTNPDWPQDDGNPVTEGALAGLTPREQQRSIFKRIVAGGGGRTGDARNIRFSDRNLDIENVDKFRRQMKTARAKIDERRGDALSANGTPTRRFLTDPPLSYRAPAARTDVDGVVIAPAPAQEPQKRGLRRFLPF